MKHNILFIKLIEPLNNGAGEGLGSIDRPIIREKTTSFPLIQPSSIKGVIRDYCDENYRKKGKSEEFLALFGPDTGHGEDHAGAISFGEGQILAFPIRSLKGLFVWATCPRILFRLQKKLTITNIRKLESLDNLLDSVMSKDNTFNPIVTNYVMSNLSINNYLILEEFSYNIAPILPNDEIHEFAREIGNLIYEPGSYWAQQFSQKLVILPEDSFRYFVENSTEVLPNIKIENNGVTKDGSLRYTEYLPRESVLYSLISYSKSRKVLEKPLDENGIQKEFENIKFDSIQIGSDETTGKGFVELKFLIPNNNSSQTGGIDNV